MFGPLKRTETVPEQIAGILQRAILGGELDVGKRLPSEKELSSQFETNRVSLRQALQILKANGLIEGGQGKAWKVADFRQNGGLHWLPALFEVQGFSHETVEIITDFLGIRTPVLKQVLALAMKRMTEEQRKELEESLAELETIVAEKAPTEQIFLGDLAWFEKLLASSNSLLYRSVYRPFSHVYKRFSAAISMVWQPPPNYPEALLALQSAINRNESEEAQELLHNYLEEESERLELMLREAAQFLPASSSIQTQPNTKQQQEVDA